MLPINMRDHSSFSIFKINSVFSKIHSSTSPAEIYIYLKDPTYLVKHEAWKGKVCQSKMNLTRDGQLLNK